MTSKRTGMDIQLLGGVFLIFGAIDLIVIALVPSSALKLFGAAVVGPFAFIVKLHSPAVHLLIGYGFAWLRPWAWGLAVAYSGFGIVSEIMNQAAFGLHAIRLWFVASALLFLGYLLWRSSLFSDLPEQDASGKPASQEAR